jgi:hypothetical protein
LASSTEILIGDRDAQHVLIRPLSRRHPGLFDYWDANWIACDIEIAVGGFKGGFHADLRSDEFPTFLEELEALNATLEGTASFTTMEGQIALWVSGDGKGHVRVTGEVLDVAGDGNRLRFGFDVDQTYLPEICRALHSLLTSFPIVGTPEEAR